MNLTECFKIVGKAVSPEEKKEIRKLALSYKSDKLKGVGTVVAAVESKLDEFEKQRTGIVVSVKVRNPDFVDPREEKPEIVPEVVEEPVVKPEKPVRKIDFSKAKPVGRVIDFSKAKPVVSGPDRKIDESAKPIMPDLLSKFESREKGSEGLYAEPEKKWYDHALDIGKSMIPYQNLMTEEGRRLHASLPEPARNTKNFLEFTKALDWMIGGEAAVAFAGRKFMKKTAKVSTEAFETVVETGMPLLKPKKNLGVTYHPPPLKDSVDTVIESVAKDITKPELAKIARKTDIRNRISDLRRGEKPLRSLVEAEAELKQKAAQEATKKGRPLLQPKTNLGQTYHPAGLQSILDTVNNQRGWMNLDPAAAKKAMKETVDKWYHKPVTEKEMSAWDQAVMLPHWIVKKYPKLKRLYGIERQRSDARSEFGHILLDNSDDFFRLKGDDLKATQRLLIHGDVSGKAHTTEELLKAGFNEKVIKAYNGVRQTLDAVQGDYWKRMAQHGVPDDEIMKLRQQLGNIEGYFPRSRYGKFFMKAEKEGANPVRAHYGGGIQGAKLKRQLEKEGYTIIEEGKNSKLLEEDYFQVKPEAISAVYERASKNLDEMTRKELKRAIADTFKERGWLGHGITRQQFWKGFETENLKKVLYDYLNGYAGFTSKMDAAKKYSKELNDLKFPKEGRPMPENDLEWATKYVRDNLANADTYDKISSTLRSAMFYKYLGGVVKSGFVNLSQNLIAAGPRLSLETPFAMTKLTKAMGDIVGHYAGKPLRGHEQRALRIALQKGWGQDQYAQELMGTLSKYGGVSHHIKKVAGAPMSIAEKFNRQSTFLAGYRAILKRNLKQAQRRLGGKDFLADRPSEISPRTPGFSLDRSMDPVVIKYREEAIQDAIKKAGRIVEDSHFVYGNSNVPGMLRGSKAGKVARSAYTFRTFTHNYVSLLFHMSGQGVKGKVAVAKSLSAIIALGGVSSFPAAKTIESIAQSQGYNPRGYIREKVDEMFGEKAGDVALYGAPAALDMDVGGSIGMELIGQKAIREKTFGGTVGAVTMDVLGVPGAIFEDTHKSIQQHHYGDIRRAIEESPITPQVMANAMQAHREYTEGITTPRGALIEDDEEMGLQKLTKSQAIRKGVFGFQSAKKTEGYRKFQARKADINRWDKKRSIIKARYLKAGRSGDEADLDRVWKEIEKFEEQKPIEVGSIDVTAWIDELYGKTKTWKDYARQERVK
jgi:hypothetical protein